MAGPSVDRPGTSTPRKIAAPELFGIVAVLITLAFIFAEPDWITHDCALYLQLGQRAVMGEVPCVDLLDTNPPLIVYASVIPAWIAEALGAPAILVFSLTILVIAVVCAWTAWALLRASPSEPLRNRAGLVAAAVLGFTLLIWGRDYGQREHILALLMAPYLVFRALRWLDGLPAGRWVRVVGPLLGVAAGIGLSLKPHHLLAAMAFEAYWVLSRRRLKPLVAGDLLSLVLAIAAYAAWMRWLMPMPAREVFWGTILPMVISGYGAYSCPPSQVLSVKLALPVGAAVLSGLLGRTLRADDDRQLAAGFAMAAFGSTLAHVIQMKGWPYHLLPALLWSVCVFAALCPNTRAARRSQASLLLAALVALVAVGLSGRRGSVDTSAAATVERYSRPGDRVLVLSTSLLDHCPLLLRLDRLHAARYVFAWPVAGFYLGTSANPDGSFPYNTPANATAQEREFLVATAEDIRRFRPPLILIRSGGGQTAVPPGFDLSEYLRQAGFIDSALKGYKRREPIPGFEVFTAIEPPTTREAPEPSPAQ